MRKFLCPPAPSTGICPLVLEKTLCPSKRPFLEKPLPTIYLGRGGGHYAYPYVCRSVYLSICVLGYLCLFFCVSLLVSVFFSVSVTVSPSLTWCLSLSLS